MRRGVACVRLIRFWGDLLGEGSGGAGGTELGVWQLFLAAGSEYRIDGVLVGFGKEACFVRNTPSFYSSYAVSVVSTDESALVSIHS